MKTLIQSLALVGGLVAATLPTLANDPAEAAAPAEPSLAIAASHVLVEGGVVMDDGMVLVGEGRILAVGKTADLEGNLPDGVHVVRHEGWLSAGLVAANSTLGLRATGDSTGPFMSGLRLMHAFDGDAKALEHARALGLTSAGVEASRSNVIGGVGGVIKTDGTVLKKGSNLTLCMTQPAVQTNRFPTTPGTAMSAVRKRFEEAAESSALAKAKAGQLVTSIAVNNLADMDRALYLAEELGLRAVIRGGAEHDEFAKELAEQGVGVALAPLGLSTNARAYNSLKGLAEAGVPFAFGIADGGNAASLRESAALAITGGVDRATAWNSITATAAKLIGAGDRVGRVATGLDADLVLWTGDPLLISTSPVAVYVGGAKSQGDSH